MASGIRGRRGEKIEFADVSLLAGTRYLSAEATTKEAVSRRAVVCFAGETKPLDKRMVTLALQEVERLKPSPKLVIFAAFQFDPEAAEYINDIQWRDVTLLKAQMNPDLMTADLKKGQQSSESFWLVGQPDAELVKLGAEQYKVVVRGFDYYDVKEGRLESGGCDRIAMWMLDTNYDGMSVSPSQVFFPMGGKNDGWERLAKSLRAEIDQGLIEKYAGTESLPFSAADETAIAVKIVDDRGLESIKVMHVGDGGKK
ncbi:MAG: hypothetical protein LBR38_04020 [Synergistaceae bacterium]|nr:hypothetical protein [Synergistaceae bacterium]